MYVHVELIWAGMLGFVLNGLIGLVVALTVSSQYFGAVAGLPTAPHWARSGDRPELPQVFEKIPLTNNKKLSFWMETIGRVTLGVFVVGVIVSLLSEQVNWGGVFWREP